MQPAEHIALMTQQYYLQDAVSHVLVHHSNLKKLTLNILDTAAKPFKQIKDGPGN
jgi:hypothetical protein